jgi:hypothetical protein
MDYKLLIACCVFSFITGMYIAVLVTKDKGCTVEFKRGQESHIVVGTRW